jgi:hypothetical protein
MREKRLTRSCKRVEENQELGMARYDRNRTENFVFLVVFNADEEFVLVGDEGRGHAVLNDIDGDVTDAHRRMNTNTNESDI